MNKDLTSIKFGLKLKYLRKSKDLTQEKLASFAGVHVRHISLIEQGKRTPSFDMLCKLASVLNYQLSEFFKFDTIECEETRLIDDICLKLKEHPEKIVEVNRVVNAMLK